MLLANTAYSGWFLNFYLGVILKYDDAKLLSNIGENVTFYWSDPVLF